ncbi:hypothetical protein QWM81_19095 [Streptomyces ficellus]|uniref:Uncharacterized protein n=1 Tax=Streptomyces ficellus TaxID=1977088 RepID=A0ABT7Z9E4_9ACTN|nr:hypothetical protein [Streptomyces ficellus]
MDVHRLVRTAVVAAAGAAAVLVLPLAPAGCGGGHDRRSDDDSGGGKPVTVNGPTPSPSTSAGTSGEAEGSWVGFTDGKPVNLTIKKGRALVLAEGHVRHGGARDDHRGAPRPDPGSDLRRRLHRSYHGHEPERRHEAGRLLDRRHEGHAHQGRRAHVS